MNDTDRDPTTASDAGIPCGALAPHGPPAQTREEIIESAHAFLWERPFRDLTVARLMDGTSVGRSAFYIHFSDRYELVAALLAEVDRELTRVTPEITPGDGYGEAFRKNLAGSIEVWTRHGPVINAISDASAHDERLEHLYRSWFIQRSVERVLNLVVAAQRVGRLPYEIDATEHATLTTLMATAYLNDRLGRLPQAPAGLVTEALTTTLEALLGLESS